LSFFFSQKFLPTLRDPAWNTLLSKIVCERIDFKPNENDGEFYMSFNDFCIHFKDLSVCTLSPDFKQINHSGN
jgi:hypothetical protein